MASNSTESSRKRSKKRKGRIKISSGSNLSKSEALQSSASRNKKTSLKAPTGNHQEGSLSTDRTDSLRSDFSASPFPKPLDNNTQNSRSSDAPSSSHKTSNGNSSKKIPSPGRLRRLKTADAIISNSKITSGKKTSKVKKSPRHKHADSDLREYYPPTPPTKSQIAKNAKPRHKSSFQRRLANNTGSHSNFSSTSTAVRGRTSTQGELAVTPNRSPYNTATSRHSTTPIGMLSRADTDVEDDTTFARELQSQAQSPAVLKQDIKHLSTVLQSKVDSLLREVVQSHAEDDYPYDMPPTISEKQAELEKLEDICNLLESVKEVVASRLGTVAEKRDRLEYAFKEHLLQQREIEEEEKRRQQEEQQLLQPQHF